MINGKYLEVSAVADWLFATGVHFPSGWDDGTSAPADVLERGLRLKPADISNPEDHFSGKGTYLDIVPLSTVNQLIKR